MASEKAVTDQEKDFDPFTIEAQRIASRRAAVLDDKDQEANWGLALSGGGIRSATFAFGVMEALATVDAVSQAPVPPKSDQKSLLRRFDYLSTVSGGGYIGAFFCSLFVPKRLDRNSDPNKAAEDAYRTFATTPPHRLRTEDVLDLNDIGHCPTAWLRENGRYLTPTGAGDYLYVASVGIRNWFALQYVVATVFLVVFAAIGLFRAALARLVPAYASNVEAHGFQLKAYSTYVELPCAHQCAPHFTIPWSPIWWLALVVLVLWVAPSCMAFWLAYPKRGQSESDAHTARRLGRPVAYAILAGLVLAAGAWFFHRDAQTQILAYTLDIGTVWVLLGIAYRVACSRGLRGDTIAGFRVRVTRATTNGIAWLLALSLLAAGDTVGMAIFEEGGTLNRLTLPAVVSGLAWIVKALVNMFDGTKGPASALKRIPLGAITSVAALVLLLLLASTWDLAVQLLTWAQPATLEQMASRPHLCAEGAVLLISLALAVVAGRFPVFINLSTLASFYSSRLTRAYLGASNGERFTRHSQARSAAEPLPSDQLDLDTYYSNESFAPVHLINVTVNQTVDPAEQLIQRDRKGRPLALTPAGFSIDGNFYRRKPGLAPKEDGKDTVSYGTESLNLGQWIGTSGAAVSTGLGRLNSFGASLGLGLANVRLGVWWASGEGTDGAHKLEYLFKRCFPTQAYLMYELTGRFFGLKRRLQYLSDGGHFENTAVYELLRGARKVELIVACDNGCDANYEFADLANLIRLARIDFGLDIVVDTDATTTPELEKVFGNILDFKGDAAVSNKCAILLNVYDSQDCDVDRGPVCRIILLKPRVVGGASIDIVNYKNDHADFPQETTANQFFDEAQWESYRDLGYRIGHLVFGCTQQGGTGAALWEYLKKPPRSQMHSPTKGPDAGVDA
jgi:hypothetical protein